MIEVLGIEDAVTKLYRQFRDLTPIMNVIASEIQRAIQMNFALHGRWDGSGTDIFSGGSQKWDALAPSTISNYKSKGWKLNPTLQRSGNLIRSIMVNASGNSIDISANAKYAAIHQFGGTINHPGGSPFFFKDGKMKFFSKDKASQLLSKGKKVKFTKPHTITIPPRPFITLTEGDLKNIMETIVKYLIE